MKYIIVFLLSVSVAFGFELPNNASEWPIFFRAMPKGGDLHYHFTGSIYPEEFIKIAAKEPYCLNMHNWQISEWSKDCDGVNTKTWLKDNPANAKKLIKAWSLTEFYPNNKQSISEHFFKAFYLFGGLVTNHKTELLNSLITRAKLQHILYLEIMLVPDASQLPDYTGKINLKNLRVWIEKNNINSLTQQTTIKNYDHSMLVLFQQAILREQPLERFIPQAILAFAIAAQQQESVGVNIVQPEHGYLALKNYKQHMNIIALLHQIYPTAKIALHAGELTSQVASPYDLSFHINDAIFKANAERIGHGVDLSYETNASKILQYMKNKPIAVEINLSSNAALLNTRGKKHPLQLYLDHNVPVVLATDDEGILRTDLSHEYWLAATEHNLNYQTIKQINRNSLTYSFIPGKSIWQDSNKNLLIAPCHNLNSKACNKFVSQNPKGKLQRQLELDLLQFENNYGKKL